MNDKLERYTYRIASGETGDSLPLTRLPYPDVSPFFPILGKKEATMLRHLYFHYPDHVEVAPALQRLAGMTEQQLDGKKLKGLVLFKARTTRRTGLLGWRSMGERWTSVTAHTRRLRRYPQPATTSRIRWVERSWIWTNR